MKMRMKKLIVYKIYLNFQKILIIFIMNQAKLLMNIKQIVIIVKILILVIKIKYIKLIRVIMTIIILIKFLMNQNQQIIKKIISYKLINLKL